MAGEQDDLGLELRLPWDRAPQQRSASEDAPVPSETLGGAAAPAPPVASAPVAWVDAPAAPVLDTAEVQRSLETLLLVLEGRFDRVEERLTHVESRGAAAQPAGAETVEQIDQQIRAARSEVDRRMDRLEGLVTASHSVTMEAVGRLEALLDTTEGRRGQAVADLSAGIAQLSARLDVFDAALLGHLDHVNSQIAASHQAVLRAIDGLVPSKVIVDLADGILARGESLDDELTELRRLLSRPEVIRSLRASQLPG